MSLRIRVLLLRTCLAVQCAASAIAFQLDSDPGQIKILFEQLVQRRLQLPDSERLFYAALLEESLLASGIDATPSQYFLLVDRNPNIQSAMIYWRSHQGGLHCIGATQVSTGKPGTFEHFSTPVGVFAHTRSNPDYRSEGTKNENGIRGYGIKGMRVFDFGWQLAQKGWGNRAIQLMRLQMHTTDPALLEARLGTRQSKGCIRIPSTMNQFLDHYAILDSDYEKGLQQGKSYWVLSPTRQPTPWSGTYLVVVDSLRPDRPQWAKSPALKKPPK